MAKITTYDVVIIGTGSAGFSAAEAAREVGASVCVIEKEKLGGECPNFACVPSKALLKAAKMYNFAMHARDYGVICNNVDFDFAKIMEYRKKVVETITGGGEWGERYEKLMKKLKVHVENGKAVFIDDHTVEVNGKLIKGKAIVIATGSVDFIPPIQGLKSINYLSWKQAILQTKRPKSMGIIGGGPVGSELATFYGALGTRVILFQSAPTILSREDEEIARLAHENIAEHGVEAVGGATVREIINANSGIYGLKVEVSGQMKTHAVEQVLVATGKRSNIEGLDIEETGVELDERNSIITNTEQRTSVKHIFAAGDVDGGMQFTHTAHHEGAVAGHNAALIAKNKRHGLKKVDLRVVPRVTFVEPEVASVGMTGEEVKERFGKVLVGRFKISALGRAVTEGSRKGLVKIVAHPKTRKILGAHIMSNRAGEMIHEAALAMHLNATVDKLGSMIHAFPTYSEGLVGAANITELE